MAYQASPKQALFLWSLITSEEAQTQGVGWSKTRPELTPSEKRELVDHGLLHLEKRGRSQFLTPTDKAWAWAAATTDVKLLRPRASVEAEVLESLLHRLLPLLRQRDIALAELLASLRSAEAASDAAALPPPAERLNGSGDHGSVSARIESACLSLAGGARKTRVRLSALRRELGDVARSSLDRTLLDMQASGKLALYRDDNSAALTPEDHSAALDINGAPRHLVLLEA